MKYLNLLLVLLMAQLSLTTGCTKKESKQERIQEGKNKLTALATLEAKSGSQIKGQVTFLQKKDGVQIQGKIVGLTPRSAHGFHIHETGDCSAADATSAGDHFNPKGMPHGSPESQKHHAGDLGNIQADQNGEVELDLFSQSISLEEGKNSVIKRAVIVHAKKDQYTQPAGDAGKRIACGVILSPFTNETDL